MSHLKPSAAAVMLALSKNVAEFNGMRFQALAQVKRQFPDVGGRDQYYGGTAYSNEGGLGIQIPAAADGKKNLKPVAVSAPAPVAADEGELLIMPVTRLYNRQRNFRPSLLMEPRILAASAILNSADAQALGIIQDDVVEITAGEVDSTRPRVD